MVLQHCGGVLQYNAQGSCTNGKYNCKRVSQWFCYIARVPCNNYGVLRKGKQWFGCIVKSVIQWLLAMLIIVTCLGAWAKKELLFGI